MVSLALLLPLLWSVMGRIVCSSPATNTTEHLQAQESGRQETLSIASDDQLSSIPVGHSDWHFVEHSTEHEPEGKVDPTDDGLDSSTRDNEHQFNTQEFLSKMSRDGLRPGDTFRTKLYDDQLYECVLLPKQNHYEHSKDSDDITHHRVHQLYGIDMNQVERKAQSISRPKLKDFGNFLYVDDSNRPSYNLLADQPNKKKTSNKAKKTRKEMDELFRKLKVSLDKLMCYQNDECYGGSLGDDNQKLDQFIRHIRMSKKIFDLLEKNRKSLALLEQDWSDVAVPTPEEPQPLRTEQMLYSDSIVEPIALKAGKNKSKSKSTFNFHSQKRPADIPVRRRLPPPPTGHSSAGVIDSMGKNKPHRTFSKRLIGNLFGGGGTSSLLTNRDSTTAKSNWLRPPRPTHTFALPSPHPASVMRPAWPKPVLVIKEYEEYTD